MNYKTTIKFKNKIRGILLVLFVVSSIDASAFSTNSSSFPTTEFYSTSVYSGQAGYSSSSNGMGEGSSSMTASGTLSASTIHSEVFDALAINPFEITHGPMRVDIPTGGGEIGQEQESPLGDVLLPMLLMALAAAVVINIKQCKLKTIK